MIIYNVTVKVDSEIQKEWLEWMQRVHIADVMKTGCFVDQTIYRLKYPIDDQGVTYAIQYRCKTMADLERYHSRFAIDLQKDHTEHYGEHVAAFRTVLEEVVGKGQES